MSFMVSNEDEPSHDHDMTLMTENISILESFKHLLIWETGYKNNILWTNYKIYKITSINDNIYIILQRKARSGMDEPRGLCNRNGFPICWLKSVTGYFKSAHAAGSEGPWLKY